MKASRHRGSAAPEEFSFPPDRFSQGEPLIGMTDDGVGHCPAWQCILCVDGLLCAPAQRTKSDIEATKWLALPPLNSLWDLVPDSLLSY